ncbi:MAG: SEL1-like repeat protein [Acidobacteriia bacterium]|nr:SEL1-like repeat protein [Terriglobia bacterium]
MRRCDRSTSGYIVLSVFIARALGIAYLRGRSVPQDYRVAAEWLRKSADQGDELGESGIARAQALVCGHTGPPKRLGVILRNTLPRSVQ